MHKAIIALEKIRTRADELRARPDKIRTEIAALDKELERLEVAGSDTDLDTAARVSVKLGSLRRQLATCDPQAETFALLNSKEGETILSDVIAAAREGLERLTRERHKAAQAVLSKLGKLSTDDLKAESVYQAGDDIAELLRDVDVCRLEIATAENLAPLVSSARQSGSWHFDAVLERLAQSRRILGI